MIKARIMRFMGLPFRDGTPNPLPDRGSKLWNQAWSALAATGRDIDEGWMLMVIEHHQPVPGGYRFHFKNHSLPFMDDDPAYDGKRKYVILPTLATDKYIAEKAI